MKQITLLISALTFFVGSTIAQNNNSASTASATTFIPSHRTCATNEMTSQTELDAFQDWLAPKVAAYLQSQENGGSPEQTFTIPTVVHVIHNSTESVGTGRNIPNARIFEQIQILNADFNRTNSDASNTPSAFTSIAANCEINFCLITEYPSGHALAGQTMPEQGVDRVSTADISGISNTTSGYSTTTINATIKPATSWNPNLVMNIWVVQISGGILGYAQFPGTGVANTDGTVIGYQFFGNTTASPYNKGRTATHEIGHFLGLRHIWGDANCGNDQISDTPTQQTSNFGCPSFPHVTCSNGVNGDMFMNYMDYTDDACMNIFTAGQKAAIQSVMTSALRRSQLNASSATLCGALSVEDYLSNENVNIFPNPATDVINVSFTSSDDAEITVFNIVGGIVYNNQNVTNKTNEIDMSQEANGIYFVRVKSGDQIVTKKLILAK
jgi:hypothetical protein